MLEPTELERRWPWGMVPSDFDEDKGTSKTWQQVLDTDTMTFVWVRKSKL